MSYIAQTVIDALQENKPVKLGPLTGAELRLLLSEINRLKQSLYPSPFTSNLNR
ncbi:TPA: hypothetical protein KD853_004729 [Vibrio parahaemolyticus]|jgi:hypothetical protein|nr:hypothetical protein [Photobacterium sp. ZSDE20]HBC3931551.1 hypothetical protein [Vibrio parahaemolyticus]